jgi:TolA-binding protein
MFCFWQWSYNKVTDHYSGLSEAKQEIIILENKLGKESAKLSLVNYQMNDFKQSVAAKIPELIPKNDFEMMRNIASVTQTPLDNKIQESKNEAIIHQAVQYFENKNYKKVVRILEDYLKNKPQTASLVNAYLMLGESYYQIHDYSGCLNVSKIMIEQFPENTSTGYVLLRVGMFFKERKKYPEAMEAFEIVKNSFLDKNLIHKSTRLISQLEKENE